MPESESVTDKIIRQVEVYINLKTTSRIKPYFLYSFDILKYYFGDVNLSKDKFLQEETQKDSGCKSITCLVSFNLKQIYK